MENTKALNIAIVSTNLNKYSETFIHNHIKFLKGNIHLLFDGYLPQKYSINRGVSSNPIINFNNNNWFNFRGGLAKDQKHTLTRAIERYLAKNNINVLFCEYGPSGVELMPVAIKLNIPLIVHFHGYDAYRNDILQSFGKHYPELFNHAKAIIAVSQHMKRQLIVLGCDEKKIHTLVYGIDTALFKRDETVIKDIDVLYCGRFVAKKAPDVAIRAFGLLHRKLPLTRLTMLGDGELLNSCRALAKELGLTNAIDFMGAVTQNALPAMLNRSTMLIQASVTTSDNDSEGTPLIILEAGACAVPVIATKHGGIADVIKDRETGLLVEEMDVQALSDKMYLLATDRELAHALGHEASKKVNQLYTLTAYIDQLNHLISTIAQGAVR